MGTHVYALVHRAHRIHHWLVLTIARPRQILSRQHARPCRCRSGGISRSTSALPLDAVRLRPSTSATIFQYIVSGDVQVRRSSSCAVID